MIGVFFCDADRHSPVCLCVVRAVGMNADKSICLVVVCDSSPFDTADRIEGVVMCELYFVSALFEFCPQLLGDIHGQIIFVKTAGGTESTYGIRFFHLGRTRADRLHSAGHLGGVSRVEDYDKSFAFRGENTAFSAAGSPVGICELRACGRSSCRLGRFR